MKYPNVYKDLDKVEKIVMSCETDAQLKVAERVLKQFIKMYPTIRRISMGSLGTVDLQVQPWKKDVTRLTAHIFKERLRLMYKDYA